MMPGHLQPLRQCLALWKEVESHRLPWGPRAAGPRQPLWETRLKGEKGQRKGMDWREEDRPQRRSFALFNFTLGKEGC